MMSLSIITLLFQATFPLSNEYFVITVVDESTGRGVPLVELRTVHGVVYHSDSQGVIAFREPELMNQEVFFHVFSHGYEHAKDGFGYRGKRLLTTPGRSAKLAIKRVNIAERLYRVTGAGVYRDSLLAGLPVPIRQPLLNAQVLGSDSVLTAVYQNRIYWFWGDTNKPNYPLGNFHVPGATSELPSRGGLDPAVGVDLTYFTNADGFAKETMRMPGDGPTWLTTLIPLPDTANQEKLYGSYVKVQPPLTTYARGLAVFNDEMQKFVHLTNVPMQAPAFPSGHAFRNTDADGIERIYFCNHPFPVIRTKATAADFQDIASYESFTCLKDGSRVDSLQLDRGPDGQLRYAWRKNTPPVGPQDETRLVKKGLLKPEELRWQLRDRDTGKSLTPHHGSAYWNDYRRRWVVVVTELFGTSALGEIWYAEADTPVGPWRYAVKIVTHDNYSFYNPKHHPQFDAEGGRVIYFEGTYTNSFSGNPQQTPRYDYNQIMYRLDLADPRMMLPVAVYNAAGRLTTTPPSEMEPRPEFFAPDRPLPGTVPVQIAAEGLRIAETEEAKALFYAIPADAKNPPSATKPLYEYRELQGQRRIYSVNPDLKQPGFERAPKPLCRVWPAE
jgi:hypothetical protein